MNKIEEIPSITSVLQSINRKMGAGTIGIASKMPILEMSRIPTGIAHFDKALGGGFPSTGMVELYGREHSGKTLTALLAIKQAQKMGLECVFVDAENSFDPEWAKQLGVDVDKLIVTQVSVAEDIVDMIAKILETQPGMIVVDSVAGMIVRAELEGDMDQQFMATKARLMSRGLAKLNALNKKTLIIWINQIRSTLTMYGAPTTTPGGNSLKHWAKIRIEIKRDSELITASGKKTDPDVIGQVVLYKIVKNKTAAPFQFGSFRFLYDGCRIEES